MEPLDGGSAGFDEAAMILGKIADRSFMPPDHLAPVEKRTAVTGGLAQFGFGSRWRVRQQSIQQRCLACSVASHQRDFFSTRNAGRKIANHALVIVGFGEMLNLEDVLARGALLLELEIGRASC